jgi:hypothetical protein
MCAYEFYSFDKADQAHSIAILQEKKENLLRITKEPVLNLGRKVIGDYADTMNIYFIQVEV